MSFALMARSWHLRPMTSTAILAIRPAAQDDAAELDRLAALDSTDVPTGQLLLAVVDGRILAALSVATGASFADPFAPTADLVDLLRRRAAGLQTPARRARPRLQRAARLHRGRPAMA